MTCNGKKFAVPIDQLFKKSQVCYSISNIESDFYLVFRREVDS